MSNIVTTDLLSTVPALIVEEENDQRTKSNNNDHNNNNPYYYRSGTNDKSLRSLSTTTNGNRIVNNSNTIQPVRFRNYTPLDPTLGSSLTNDNNNDQQSNIDEDNDIEMKNERRSGKLKPLDIALNKAKQELLLQQQQQSSSSSKVSSSSSSKQLQQQQPSNKSSITIDELVPKKVNWDLKRNFQSKLNKLEKRTQRAILQLLKQKLQKDATEAIIIQQQQQQQTDGTNNNDLD